MTASTRRIAAILISAIVSLGMLAATAPASFASASSPSTPNVISPDSNPRNGFGVLPFYLPI